MERDAQWWPRRWMRMQQISMQMLQLVVAMLLMRMLLAVLAVVCISLAARLMRAERGEGRRTGLRQIHHKLKLNRAKEGRKERERSVRGRSDGSAGVEPGR